MIRLEGSKKINEVHLSYWPNTSQKGIFVLSLLARTGLGGGAGHLCGGWEEESHVGWSDGDLQKR